MKKGDTYCTIWTTYIAGPFTFNGAENITTAVIVGSPESLLLVKEGFDIFFNHTLDGDYDFINRVLDFLSNESINEVIDKHPDKVLELEELKKFSKQIKKVVGGKDD